MDPRYGLPQEIIITVADLLPALCLFLGLLLLFTLLLSSLSLSSLSLSISLTIFKYNIHNLVYSLGSLNFPSVSLISQHQYVRGFFTRTLVTSYPAPI